MSKTGVVQIRSIISGQADRNQIMLQRGGQGALTRTQIKEFLDKNDKLVDIRNKLRDPMLSKTHQANWSNSVMRRFDSILKDYQKSGNSADLKDLNFNQIQKPNQIPT